MGRWGLENPNLVRILKTVRNIGRSLIYCKFLTELFGFQEITNDRKCNIWHNLLKFLFDNFNIFGIITHAVFRLWAYY